jgi:murein DD-endopeptidase MepM/ murein hydrolase activator NlpD
MSLVAVLALAALVPLAPAIDVAQGDAVAMSLPDEPGLTSVALGWQGRSVPYVRDGTAWATVLGVDLDVAPGSYPVTVTLRYGDGRSSTRQEVLDVTGQAFPTTELTVAPQYVDPPEDEVARILAESERLGGIFSEVGGGRLWSEPFEVPIPGAVGSNFGHRRVFNGESRNPHSGADIAASEGTPIRSSNRGRVVETGDYYFNGNTVVVDHGLGIYAVYLHLSRIDVEVGQIVERGEVVGLVGATGRVTGPHLHWGFRVQNARVDPFSMLRLSN